ncbi:MAG: F0F1 ATP synthase subunit epsilon [Peptococcaceae bacterium]
MADKTLKLEVITPEQVALRDESTSVVVPGVDGELGIWPNHAPLLAGLKPGVVTYKTASGTEKLVVSGGFIEISNNVISILAPAAEKSTEIDFARAEAAKKRAEERLAKKEGIDMARAQAALARANARLSVR